MIISPHCLLSYRNKKSRIDIDLHQINIELGSGRADAFQNAREIYMRGGHSRAYAEVTLLTDGGVLSRVRKGASVSVFLNNNTMTGTVMEDVGIGGTSVRILYPDAAFLSCQVGALPLVGTASTLGCYPGQGTLSFDENGGSYDYRYNVLVDNKNDRTLQSFSSNAEENMLLCGDSCPQPMFDKFFQYYKVPDYADRFILAAFGQSKASFSRGSVNFGSLDDSGRAQAIEVGMAVLNVWMQVVYEMNHALNLCDQGQSGQALHAWDAAVAFYSGYLQGNDHEEGGIMLHALADKFCAAFNTCSQNGNQSGRALVNLSIMRQFELGQSNLVEKECEAVRESLDSIETAMTVPLVQGTLLSAYWREHNGQHPHHLKHTAYATGATFAASVLPLVHACNPADAAIVYRNLRVGSGPSNFIEVKHALERNYECLGITCPLVGGIYNNEDGQYYTDASPCQPFQRKGGGSNVGSVVAGALFGVAVVFLVALGWLFRVRQSETLVAASAMPEKGATVGLDDETVRLDQDPEEGSHNETLLKSSAN